jgi:putative transposase
MPNHVHLIAVPDAEVSLRYAIGDAHEIYSKFINRRNGWRGYFWQGRFFSVPMDPAYTLTCARYIECNPVRGKLCDNPFDYQWSSARAHLSNTNDLLVEVRPMLDQVGNWADFLNVVDTQEIYESIRLNSRTGRPLGTECFMKKLEHATGLHLIKKNGGKRPPLPSTLRD